MGRKANIGKGKEILEGPGVDIKHASLLDSLFDEVQKDFANLERAADETVDLWCPTGNAAFDLVLSDMVSGGGWPFGRIVELYGNASSGKTMLALFALMNTVHRLGGVAIILDVEKGFVPSFYEKLGGDPRYLWVESPNYISDCYETGIKVIQKVRAKHPDIPITVVYDSIPAALTKKEFEEALDKSDPMGRARDHRKGLSKVMTAIKRTKTLFIGINQLVSTMATFGPDQDTVGGTGPKYWSSVRVNLKKGKKIYLKGDGKVGEWSKDSRQRLVGTGGKLQVEKTRFTAPFRQIGFDIFYDSGIHPYSGWFEALRDHAPGKFFKEALTQKGTIKSGYFVPNGCDQKDTGAQFTSNTFMGVLAEHPEMRGIYPYDVDFGLPKPEELEEVEVDERTGKEITVDSEDDSGTFSNDPSDASEV